MNEEQKEQAEKVRVFFKTFLPNVQYTVVIDDWLYDDKLIVTTLKNDIELMIHFQHEYLKLKTKGRKNKSV